VLFRPCRKADAADYAHRRARQRGPSCCVGRKGRRLAGAKLDQLELSTLVSLLGEFDAESRDLLAAYLDRRHPRWREDAQGNAATGSGPA
jgi:hypothetical protein